MEAMAIHNHKGQSWTLAPVSLILFIGWGEDGEGNPGGSVLAGQGKQSAMTTTPCSVMT